MLALVFSFRQHHVDSRNKIAPESVQVNWNKRVDLLKLSFFHTSYIVTQQVEI